MKNSFKIALATLAITAFPSTSFAALECKPPAQLICWADIMCYCDTIQVIELEGQEILYLPNLGVGKKPSKVDEELYEQIKKKMEKK